MRKKQLKYVLAFFAIVFLLSAAATTCTGCAKSVTIVERTYLEQATGTPIYIQFDSWAEAAKIQKKLARHLTEIAQY